MIQEIDPDVLEQMKRIAGNPVGRTKLIASLKDIFDLPSWRVLSFVSIPSHVPKNVKKIWLTGVVPGVVIIDGQDFDPRLFGLLSRGNGHALHSLLPFEDKGAISLNIWPDPITDTVVKAYGREYPVWVCWELKQGNEIANGGFAIHQNQWRGLEPWLRKYLPPANAQKTKLALAG